MILSINKYVMLFLLTISINSYASVVENSVEDSTKVNNTLIDTTLLNPSDWRLSPTEWSKFQKLMQGPSRLWYEKLSPPEILGINSNSRSEQDHYAEIVAHMEHDKLARELIFDQAVHRALFRLFPNEPVVNSFDLSRFSPIKKEITKDFLQNGDHIILFVDINKEVRTLITTIIEKVKNTKDLFLDIYCENSDKAAIQAWAKSNNLPIDLVSQGRITLNSDNGKLQKIGNKIELPLVLLLRNGETKKLELEKL